MQETQVQPLGWEYPLDKEMAIHSIIPDWETPRAEEPHRRLLWCSSEKLNTANNSNKEEGGCGNDLVYMCLTMQDTLDVSPTLK